MLLLNHVRGISVPGRPAGMGAERWVPVDVKCVLG